MLVMPFGCTAISILLTSWSMKQRLTAMLGSCTSAVNQSVVWPVSGVKLRLPAAVTVDRVAGGLDRHRRAVHELAVQVQWR